MKPAFSIWDDVSYQLGDAVAGAPQNGESRMAESGLGCSTVQCISVTWVFFFFFIFLHAGQVHCWSTMRHATKTLARRRCCCSYKRGPPPPRCVRSHSGNELNMESSSNDAVPDWSSIWSMSESSCCCAGGGGGAPPAPGGGASPGCH